MKDRDERLGKREPLRAGGRGEIQWPRGLMVWHRTDAPMLEGGEPATNPTKHDSKTQRMVAMNSLFVGWGAGWLIKTYSRNNSSGVKPRASYE